MIPALQTLIDAGRIPHALVIDGGSYEARLTCARELASTILHETQKVMADLHPDVITVLPEEKKKTLSVELIRSMRDDAYIIPNENERKVYIIAKAELMLDYAQNALLKILEEPPQYAVFILLCDSHSCLLPTVLSRVAVFSLDRTREDTAAEETPAECLTAARALARKAVSGSRFDLLKEIAVFEKNYDLLSPSLDCLLTILRDALVIASGGTALLSGAEEEAKQLAASLTAAELLAMQSGIKEIKESIRIYGNKTLTLTRLEYKLARR